MREQKLLKRTIGMTYGKKCREIMVKNIPVSERREMSRYVIFWYAGKWEENEGGKAKKWRKEVENGRNWGNERGKSKDRK